MVVAGIRLYRDGLALTLTRDHGFDVVGTADDAVSAERLLRSTAPDLVLLDMAVTDSLDLARAIAGGDLRARVVALGLPRSEASVISCAEAGIVAYVLSDASLDELAATLRRALNGETVCSPRVAGSLMRRVARLAAERPGFPQESPLTPREEEIVSLIDQGFSNKEIARQLYIEVATVKNHVHNILEKLHVDRRAQAAARIRALRYGPVAATGATAVVERPSGTVS